MLQYTEMQEIKDNDNEIFHERNNFLLTILVNEINGNLRFSDKGCIKVYPCYKFYSEYKFYPLFTNFGCRMLH